MSETMCQLLLQNVVSPVMGTINYLKTNLFQPRLKPPEVNPESSPSFSPRSITTEAGQRGSHGLGVQDIASGSILVPDSVIATTTDSLESGRLYNETGEIDRVSNAVVHSFATQSRNSKWMAPGSVDGSAYICHTPLSNPGWNQGWETNTEGKYSKDILTKALRKRDKKLPGRSMIFGNKIMKHDIPSKSRINNKSFTLFDPNQIARGYQTNKGGMTHSIRMFAKTNDSASSYRGSNTLARSARISSQVILRNVNTVKSTDHDAESLRHLLLELEARKVKGFENFEAITRERERRDEAIKILQSVQIRSKEVIRQVSAQTRRELAAFLGSRDQFKEIRSIGGFLITPNNLRSLSGAAWLNDEVINAYLYLVKTRENSKDDRLRLMVLNSMFFTSLQEKGYKSVARWSKRAGAGGSKILDLDGVIIPVHKQAHWTLAYINVKHRRLEYYDSLFGNWSAASLLREYLKGELGPDYKESEWSEYNEAREICPVQKNGYDCGVFLCKTAEVICRGGTLSYTQKDIPDIRVLMQADLLKGSLDWEDQH